MLSHTNSGIPPLAMSAIIAWGLPAHTLAVEPGTPLFTTLFFLRCILATSARLSQAKAACTKTANTCENGSVTIGKLSRRRTKSFQRLLKCKSEGANGIDSKKMHDDGAVLPVCGQSSNCSTDLWLCTCTCVVPTLVHTSLCFLLDNKAGAQRVCMRSTVFVCPSHSILHQPSSWLRLPPHDHGSGECEDTPKWGPTACTAWGDPPTACI